MRRLLFVFLFLVFFTDTQAQTTASWPLTPEEIFGPDVHIEYVTYFTPQATDPSWLDELRVLNIDGNLYLYPETFEHISEIVAFDKNTFLIGNVINAELSDLYEFWYFDRQTHEISRFESACGDSEDEFTYLKPSSLIDLFHWTIITDSKTSRWCNRFTGQLSDPLPANYQWFIDIFGPDEPWLVFSISPDKRYIAFVGEVGLTPQASDARNMELFSYDTVERRLISLGEFRGETLIELGWWVDHQILLYSGETCSICKQTFFIADASRPASLETAFTYHNDPPIYDTEQERYIFGARTPGSTQCGETIYDVATRTLTTRELGGCRPDFGSIDGVGYYRNVPIRPSTECCQQFPEDVPTVAVTRWDARTDTSEDVYEGEIEEVRWVSSDDRYAIMLRDTNGKIDHVPYNFWPPGYGLTTFLELIDLETQKVLRSIEQSYGAQFALLPLSDRDFLKLQCVISCDHRLSINPSVLHIGDQRGVLEEVLPKKFVIGPTPDRSGIFYWLEPAPADVPSDTLPSVSGIGIYDLQTRKTQILVNPLDPELYETEVSTLGDKYVTIKVTPRIPDEADAANPIYGDFYRVYFEDQQSTVSVPQFVPAVSSNACLLEVNADTGLYEAPSQTLTDSVQKGQLLLAGGQTTPVGDSPKWWLLADGRWIRSDYTDETGICDSIMLVEPTAGLRVIPVLQQAITATSTEQTAQILTPSCTVTTLSGVNLRGGPGPDFEPVSSTYENTQLTVDGYQYNDSQVRRWWHITNGGWVHEDYVREDAACNTIRELSNEDTLVTPQITTEAAVEVTATVEEMASGPFCTVTTLTGVNLRSGAGAEFEKIGSAAESTALTAVGQAMSSTDALLWWKLDDESWIRSDFVAEDATCGRLPVVTITE
jgi:uncharacterized protein YraI